MSNELELYALDPIRGLLAPKLVGLMEPASASRCALVWSAVGRPEEYHSYLTLTTEGEAGPLDLPKGFALSSRKESVTGRLRSGQTRTSKCRGLFIAERAGRCWFLVLQSHRRLNVGRDLARYVEAAFWGAAWAVGRIEHVEPTGHLDAMSLLAEGEAEEEAAAFSKAGGLYSRSYEVALSVGNEHAAVQAAWYRGRTFRNTGKWDEAGEWYGWARNLAGAMENTAIYGEVTTGLAHIRTQKGDYPGARRLYQEVVELGLEAGRPGTQSLGYSGLMAVDIMTEDLRAGLKNGWAAHLAAESDDESTTALGGLAHIFWELGFEEEAWCTNLALTKIGTRQETRTMAIHNLSRIAAARGDEIEYEKLRRDVDEEAIPAYSLALIILEDAQSLLALGRRAEGLAAYERAIRFAEEYKVGKIIFKAEAELEAAVAALRERPDPPKRSREEREIRAQLEELYGSLIS